MTDAVDPILAGGQHPATPEDLFRRLEALGIVTATVQHPAVFTVEEARQYRGHIAGCHTKNLFVRNKKGVMWLITCLEDRTVDLKALGAMLGAGRFSFGSHDRLMRYLGLTPGSVTPFGIVNDHGGAVRVALDRGMLAREPLNFHPLINTMTTSIGTDDFLRFLEAENHAPVLIDAWDSGA